MEHWLNKSPHRRMSCVAGVHVADGPVEGLVASSVRQKEEWVVVGEPVSICARESADVVVPPEHTRIALGSRVASIRFPSDDGRYRSNDDACTVMGGEFRHARDCINIRIGHVTDVISASEDVNHERLLVEHVSLKALKHLRALLPRPSGIHNVIRKGPPGRDAVADEDDGCARCWRRLRRNGLRVCRRGFSGGRRFVSASTAGGQAKEANGQNEPDIHFTFLASCTCDARVFSTSVAAMHVIKHTHG